MRCRGSKQLAQMSESQDVKGQIGQRPPAAWPGTAGSELGPGGIVALL